MKAGRTLSAMAVNRTVYAFMLIGSGLYAWLTGERIMYVTFAVFIALPVVSFLLTLLLLKGLRVSQMTPDAVIKNETGYLTVRLHNATPLPFGKVEIEIMGDEHAVTVKEKYTAVLRTMRITAQKIPFTILYCGHFAVGLKAVYVTDIVGLFRMKRKYTRQVIVTSLPRVIDLSEFPLAMNLLTHAHSRYDIRDEDYSTISYIRPYVPTDSIKRVHWKLTAKRNEWLVKVFQSNALNQVIMILDSTRHELRPKERYALEDRMVEMSIGLAKFCLNKGMPVEFLTTQGDKTSARGLPEFDIIYHATSALYFEPVPPIDCLSILTHILSDATGYVNAVIFTARLDSELYERIINAANNGHYLAILYFATSFPDIDSERIYQVLLESGIRCFRITDE